MQAIKNLESEKQSLVSLLVQPVVLNARRKTRSTFNPKVALRYKDYFDTAIQLGKSIKIHASDFPRLSVTTIRQQANDALLYLIHHYSTIDKEVEARYLRFRVMSKLRTCEDGVEILHGFEIKNSGITREVVAHAIETIGLKPVQPLSNEKDTSLLDAASGTGKGRDSDAWRMELIDWLNEPVGTSFIRNGTFKPSDLSFVNGLAEANDMINESVTNQINLSRRLV